MMVAEIVFFHNMDSLSVQYRYNVRFSIKICLLSMGKTWAMTHGLWVIINEYVLNFSVSDQTFFVASMLVTDDGDSLHWLDVGDYETIMKLYVFPRNNFSLLNTKLNTLVKIHFYLR